MKKIAGIVLVVAVLVGAPLAWHYHSPLPFLPAFFTSQPPPPAEDSAVMTDGFPPLSPGPGAEEQPSYSDISPLEPPSSIDAMTDAVQAVPNETLEEDEVFSLETIESPEEEGPALDLPPPPPVDIPPPLPVLP